MTSFVSSPMVVLRIEHCISKPLGLHRGIAYRKKNWHKRFQGFDGTQGQSQSLQQVHDDLL